MVTPFDKIQPHARHQNDIIQIIVTRSCDLLFCSDCTQLLPYRKDVRHMSLDVFREALRSLEGWPGVRALFGGNPCSHPHFDALCEILQEEVPDQTKRGLWSNNLLGHGEIVRETFWPHARWNLNIHAEERAAAEMEKWLPGIPILGRGKPSWHSPVLIHWEDMGLTYSQWVEKRENCDVNQRWSGAIAERDGRAYSYFCEIAAALDGVRGENHGLLARPGWWRLKIDSFDNQIKQCCDRGCGIPLKYKGHLDSDEIYDVSPRLLQIVDKTKKPEIQIHTEPPESTAIATDYQKLFSK